MTKKKKAPKQIENQTKTTESKTEISGSETRIIELVPGGVQSKINLAMRMHAKEPAKLYEVIKDFLVKGGNVDAQVMIMGEPKSLLAVAIGFYRTDIVTLLLEHAQKTNVTISIADQCFAISVVGIEIRGEPLLQQKADKILLMLLDNLLKASLSIYTVVDEEQYTDYKEYHRQKKERFEKRKLVPEGIFAACFYAKDVVIKRMLEKDVHVVNMVSAALVTGDDNFAFILKPDINMEDFAAFSSSRKAARKNLLAAISEKLKTITQEEIFWSIEVLLNLYVTPQSEGWSDKEMLALLCNAMTFDSARYILVELIDAQCVAPFFQLIFEQVAKRLAAQQPEKWQMLLQEMLCKVAFKNMLEIAVILLRAGAQVDTADISQQGTVFLPEEITKQIFRELAKKNAQIGSPDAYECKATIHPLYVMSALTIAIIRGHHAMAKLLVEHSANIILPFLLVEDFAEKSLQTQSFTKQANEEKKVNSKKLLKKQRDLLKQTTGKVVTPSTDPRRVHNIIAYVGSGPLLAAVIKGDLVALKICCDQLSKTNNDMIDTRDYHYGRTGLIIAAQDGQEAIVEYLLEKGSNLYMVDIIEQKTAREWAIKNGHSEVAKKLLTAELNDRYIEIERLRSKIVERIAQAQEVSSYIGDEIKYIDSEVKKNNVENTKRAISEHDRQQILVLIKKNDGLKEVFEKITADYKDVFSCDIKTIAETDKLPILQRQKLLLGELKKLSQPVKSCSDELNLLGKRIQNNAEVIWRNVNRAETSSEIGKHKVEERLLTKAEEKNTQEQKADDNASVQSKSVSAITVQTRPAKKVNFTSSSLRQEERAQWREEKFDYKEEKLAEERRLLIQILNCDFDEDDEAHMLLECDALSGICMRIMGETNGMWGERCVLAHHSDLFPKSTASLEELAEFNRAVRQMARALLDHRYSSDLLNKVKIIAEEKSENKVEKSNAICLEQLEWARERMRIYQKLDSTAFASDIFWAAQGRVAACLSTYVIPLQQRLSSLRKLAEWPEIERLIAQAKPFIEPGADFRHGRSPVIPNLREPTLISSSTSSSSSSSSSSVVSSNSPSSSSSSYSSSSSQGNDAASVKVLHTSKLGFNSSTSSLPKVPTVEANGGTPSTAPKIG